jgi:hypothetical protein
VSTIRAGFSEYDRFGPWIYEVTDADEVPRLYRSYPIDLGAARLVLKVPRDIARRDATPDMDLYDHLVILDQDRLTLLSRRGARVAHGATASGDPDYDVVVVELADIVAIHDVVNLLDGRLTVATSAGASITMPYNGSANDTVARLVRALRVAAGEKTASPVGLALQAAGLAAADATAVASLGSDDTYLVSHVLELRTHHPDLVAWASHGKRALAPGATGPAGVFPRLAHALSPMTLHGALLVADGAAMELLGRHAWLVRGRHPIYSTSRLLIPFGAVDRLDLSPHPVYPGVTVVTIRAGEWATDVPVPSDSTAAQLLSAAALAVRN